MRDAAALGQRIRERRVERDLSQRQLAGAELSPSYISLLESGKRWPTLDALELIAAKLSTTSAALVSGQGSHPRDRSELDLDLKWAKIALRAGNPESAEKYARVVLDDSSISEAERLDALSLVAAATEGQGRVSDAIDILEPLVEELDADQTRQLWLSCQIMLLRCYKDVGDFNHAVDLGERALGRANDLMQEDEMMLAISLASAYSLRGDLKRASNLLRMIATRAESAGSHRARGGALWNSSVVADEDGRLDDAVKLAEQALMVFSESDAVRNLGVLRCQYADYLLDQSDGGVELARQQLTLARRDLDMEGTVVDQTRCAVQMSRCELIAGDIEAAESHIMEAQLMVRGGPESETAEVDFMRGHILAAQGDLIQAMVLVQGAAEQIESLGSASEAARAWKSIADLARAHGFADVAMTALDRAMAVMGVRPTRVGTTHSTEVARDASRSRT